MSLSRWSSSTLSDASDRSRGSTSSPPRKRTTAVTMDSFQDSSPSPSRLCDSSSISERNFDKIKGIMSDNNCNWHDLYYCMWRAGIVRQDSFDIHTYCARTLGVYDFDIKSSRGTSSNRTVQNLEKAWIKVQLLLLGKASFEALLSYLWEQGYRPWLTESYRKAKPNDWRCVKYGPHNLLTFQCADEQPSMASTPAIPFPKIRFVPKEENKDEMDRQADAQWQEEQAQRPRMMKPVANFSRLPSYESSVEEFQRPGSNQTQSAKRPENYRAAGSDGASWKAVHDRSESRLSSHHDYKDLPIFGTVNAKGQLVSNKTKKRHRLARRFKKKKQPKEKPAGLRREKDGKLMKANPVYQAVKTKRGWF